MSGLSKGAISLDPVCRELTKGRSGKTDKMKKALALIEQEGMGRIEAAELAGVNPTSILNFKRREKLKNEAEPAGRQAQKQESE
jgi:hypothetical protein